VVIRRLDSDMPCDGLISLLRLLQCTSHDVLGLLEDSARHLAAIGRYQGPLVRLGLKERTLDGLLPDQPLGVLSGSVEELPPLRGLSGGEDDLVYVLAMLYVGLLLPPSGTVELVLLLDLEAGLIVQHLVPHPLNQLILSLVSWILLIRL
jgi:hypothetical protein